MSNLTNHKTIRKYSNREVDNNTLNEILYAGVRASNTGNMQLYSIIATRSDKIKAKLAPAHFNQPMITQAPVVLTFCADVNRYNKWCALRNTDPGTDNLESLTTAIVDTVICAQNVCVAAEEKGLGICYLGTTTYNPHMIIEALNLPKGVMPITTVTLGYPDEDPVRQLRLPLEAITHNDTYCDYSDANINAYYSEEENDSLNKKFVAENKKQNLAQVFAEVRYTRQASEAFGKILLETIQKQGFKL